MSTQKKVVDDLLPDEEVGELVPDPQVCREFQITSMTLWRWDHDPELKFPPPVRIRKRKFRHRSALEDFKRQLLRNVSHGARSLPECSTKTGRRPPPLRQ